MALSRRTQQSTGGLALFAGAAVLVLAGFAWFLGGLRLGPVNRYHVDFAYAAGLEVGAPVRVSGIKVGQVRGLQLLLPQSQPAAAAPLPTMGQRERAIVRASLAMSADCRPLISAGTTFAVVTTGIIGDAFLEMTPAQGTPWAPSAALRGIDAPRLHQMALASQTVLSAVAPLFANLQTETADGTNRIASVEALMQDVAAVAAAMHRALGEGDNLRQGLDDGAALVAGLRLAAPEMVHAVLQVLRPASALMQELNNPLAEAQMKSLRQDTAAALTQLAATATEVRALVLSVQRGEGTLGGLWRDPQIYEDVRDLVHELRAHPYKLLWRR